MNRIVLMLLMLTIFSSCRKQLSQWGFEAYVGWIPDLDEEYLAKVADGTRVLDGDHEPKWPGKKRYETLDGVDSDNDGLRDDLEIFINTYVPDYNRRMAWKQYLMVEDFHFKNINKFKNESEAFQHYKKLSKRHRCLLKFYFPGDINFKLTNEVNKILREGEIRFSHWKKYRLLIIHVANEGQIILRPKTDPDWLEYCQFEVKKPFNPIEVKDAM